MYGPAPPDANPYFETGIGRGGAGPIQEPRGCKTGPVMIPKLSRDGLRRAALSECAWQAPTPHPTWDPSRPKPDADRWVGRPRTGDGVALRPQQPSPLPPSAASSPCGPGPQPQHAGVQLQPMQRLQRRRSRYAASMPAATRTRSPQLWPQSSAPARNAVGTSTVGTMMMMTSWIQAEVMVWVRDGCHAGCVYED